MSRTGLFAMFILLLLPGCTSPSRQFAVNDTVVQGELAELLDQVASYPAPEGVDREVFAMLRAELARVLEERYMESKSVSTPPTDPLSETVLSLNQAAGALEWGYYCTGDYDQNGEVNVADLTPLGANYLASGPFDPDSAEAVIDGDNNGELNIADVTPIGANFGNLVSGYEIYQSASDGDYPGAPADPNGPGTALVDTVALDTAVGAGRKRFSHTLASPATGAYYWVRPVDGEDTPGTPSNLYQMGGGGLPDEVPLPFAEFEQPLVPGAGINGPFVVDEAPAFLIIEDKTPDPALYYIRAENTEGSSWNVPVEIAVAATGTPSLAIIDGYPAIAYSGGWSGPLYYVRALDAQGATWDTPVVVDDTTPGAGWECCLLDVNERPAIGYTSDGGGPDEKRVLYIRADDATGTAWSDPPQILDPDYVNGLRPSKMEMLVVAGNPGIAYSFSDPTNDNDFGYRYVSATDADGGSWNTPVTVTPIFDSSSLYPAELSLVDLGGYPAIGFFIFGFDAGAVSGAYFVSATDAAGSSWGAVQTVDEQGAGGGASVSDIGTDDSYYSIASFAVYEKLDLSWGIAAVVMKGYSESADCADIYLADVGTGGSVDWSQKRTLTRLVFEQAAATSSAHGPGATHNPGKQASCLGSDNFLLLLLVLMLKHGALHCTSADEHVYHGYALVGEWSPVTMNETAFFAHMEIPADLMQ